MSLLIMNSDILLKRLECVAKSHGERNIRLLVAIGKADKTKSGHAFKGRNEVILA